MKESLKLSCYISKYYNKYKKYPETSLQFYKYGRLIGQGAFGKVNLGLNILTGRIVAVKSFNKNNSELTGENMKKIKYETDLMKKLNHPNITKILEMFEDEKYFLIIMEYINGGNLFSFVKKRRKLSEKTAKFLFRQIILGIKYIHEQNIVHRDIKLENLLIDLNNNVKICDFGIGRKLENKKQLLHDQCGTLMYMAPEILLSSKEKGYEGFPVDIWSAGISLYIMLSGTLPFNYKNKKKHKKNEGEEDDEEEEEEEESISSSKSKSKKNDDDNFELQYNIVYKEPKHIEKISDEARDLLKGLLNKDPKKRFTCEQILNHPWLYNFKEKNNSSNKFHLFTKAEMIMLSKTFIDYRRANYDDLKENFTLSNLENENDKNNVNEQNITSKSSILAPYNSIISDYDNSSARSIIKHDDDSFDDFNNSKIKLEKDQIVFSKKIKEYNRLYELNNNGEVDNGVLINSKTQSSINMSERSSNSRTENKFKDSDMNLILNKGSFVIINENDNDILRVKESKKKIEDIIVKNDNEKNLDEQIEHKIKSNNILNQMSLMGYDKKYVLDCVEKNELCHASTVYYLMMNYENI
jgi:serine/threonine protein kinase